MLRWYVIHTKPASESVARTHLARQGYEVYLPRVIQPMRRAGRWRDRIVALFPRYLFLRLREGQQPLGPVRSSVGVSSVVHFGSSYAVVPDRIVTDIQSRADPESGLHRLSAPPSLTSGMDVRITGGLFEGLEGVFQRESGADRVVVLLKLLGQDASVRVPSALVMAGHIA